MTCCYDYPIIGKGRGITVTCHGDVYTEGGQHLETRNRELILAALEFNLFTTHPLGGVKGCGHWTYVNSALLLHLFALFDL